MGRNTRRSWCLCSGPSPLGSKLRPQDAPHRRRSSPCLPGACNPHPAPRPLCTHPGSATAGLSYSLSQGHWPFPGEGQGTGGGVPPSRCVCPGREGGLGGGGSVQQGVLHAGHPALGQVCPQLPALPGDQLSHGQEARSQAPHPHRPWRPLSPWGPSARAPPASHTAVRPAGLQAAALQPLWAPAPPVSDFCQ